MGPLRCRANDGSSVLGPCGGKSVQFVQHRLFKYVGCMCERHMWCRPTLDRHGFDEISKQEAIVLLIQQE